MDNLNEGNIIKLNDDRDYVIVNKISYNNNTYLNLLTVEEPANLLIVKAENNYGITLLNEIDNNEELFSVLEIIENS